MNKTKKTLKRVIYGRTFLFVFLLLFQLIILLGTYWAVTRYSFWLTEIIKISSIVIMIYIINNDENAMYKLSWIMPILIVPAFGTLLYIYLRLRLISTSIAKKYVNIKNKLSKYLLQDQYVKEEIKDKSIYTMVNYVNKMGYPIYKNTLVDYYKIGEEFFEQYKKDLKKAKKYIFIEYFIIGDNSMWNEILEILKEKISDGVEIRVIYDGFGSLTTLPMDYDKYLNELGIKCQIFCPVKPILDAYQNNRDHRKITVIDGKVGYTGGLNLSDEYVNRIVRHGHWKDTAIRLDGEAVNSLNIMFMHMWDVLSKTSTKYDNYIVEYKNKSDGYIMPYTDNPLDNDSVGKNVYLDVINNSNQYLYITTPYLILDDEVICALKHCAERGVDTTIILPHISDGKGTREVATSYYEELIKSGVKIYEYTPGFVHSKMFVSDDDKAIVGTINLDYRSLYLHFEDAVFIYKNSCIKNIKKDLIDVISKSNQITLKNYKNISLLKRIVGRILRVFAPLM